MYDELVKRLRCQRFGNCPNCAMWYTEEVEPNLWRERCAAIDAADAIEDLIADLTASNEVIAKSKRKWISVEERLPENNGKFIALAYGEANTMDYYYGHWMYIGTDYTKVVTHWMPLPEPPEVDKPCQS